MLRHAVVVMPGNTDTLQTIQERTTTLSACSYHTALGIMKSMVFSMPTMVWWRSMVVARIGVVEEDGISADERQRDGEVDEPLADQVVVELRAR